MPTYFMVLAGLVIIALAIIACLMQYRVKKIKADKARQQQDILALKEKHQTHLNNSVQILAQGLVDDQLTLTEGAIRISVLLDNLLINDKDRKLYRVFFQLAEATSHIPVLDAWKKLSKKEKKHFEKERIKIEEHYKELIIDAARNIRGKRFGTSPSITKEIEF